MTPPNVGPNAHPAPPPDDELEYSMKNPRKSQQVIPVIKSTPKKGGSQIKNAKAKAKKEKIKSLEQVTPPGLNEVDEVLSDKLDVKAQLTLMELRFMELRLTGGMTTDQAVIAAGYGDYSQKQRYRIATKIVQKYESQAGDHRKIFRGIGAGELAVAEGLFNLATTAKSEMVRLNAWQAIARCLGVTKEIADGVQGVKIIINAADGQQLKVGVCVPTGENVLPGPTTITK